MFTNHFAFRNLFRAVIPRSILVATLLLLALTLPLLGIGGISPANAENNSLPTGTPGGESAESFPGVLNVFSGADPQEWQRGLLLPENLESQIIYETLYNGGDLEHGEKIVVDESDNAFVLVSLAGGSADVHVVKLDPAGKVLFTTTLAGSGLDAAHAIALDLDGNLVVTGRTLSEGFPVFNAYQATMNGQSDLFISRLDGETGDLLYSTFLGGGRAERSGDVAIGPDGDIYITGSSNFTDYPVTSDALQPELVLTQCFCFDAVFTRMAADGQSLVYSTYLGGAFTDHGWYIGLDGAQNIYITGQTESDDFPTANPIQPTLPGGEYDNFVARIAADGSTLDYSTFLGGSDRDLVREMEVDEAGNAYLVGYTRSINYPTTPGAFQPTFVGGIGACGSPPFDPIHNCEDVFISKILPDGSDFAYSTFLAGTHIEEARGMGLGADGSVYVTGWTASADFPGIGSGENVYISKLTPDGSDLVYTESFFSGSGSYGMSLTVGDDGDVYFAGALGVPSDTYIVRYREELMAVAPTLTITIGQISRSNENPSCTYNLFHSSNPYSGFTLLQANMGTAPFDISGAMGGAPDFYYVEVDCGVGGTAVSNTAGEFTFVSIPGS